QSAYAAASAAADALMVERHRLGLPAKSLAWGLWEQRSELTAQLSATDLRRMARGGVHGLSAEQGTTLFDTALTLADPALVPVRLDLAAYRDQPVPHILRSLVQTLTRSRSRSAADGSLRRRLAAADADERGRILLETVRTQAAEVLGHADASV